MDQSATDLFHWLSALIAMPAVAYAAQPFFRSAYAALKAGRLNMDVPISLGIGLATAMSLFQTIRGTDQVYFDAAISLTFFLLIGRYLDEKVRVRARGAAENLLGLKALAADVVDDGWQGAAPARARAAARHARAGAGRRARSRRWPRGERRDARRYKPHHRRERAASDGCRRDRCMPARST